MARLLDDLPLLGDVLHALVAPEANQANLSADQFLDRLDGDCIYQAHRVLLEELTDFFRALNRPELAMVLEVQSRTLAKLLEAMKTLPMESLMNQAVEMVFAPTPSPTAGQSPELPESIPAS